MNASHDLTRISTRFDEPNLVAQAGLLAPAALVQRIGLAELVTDTLHLPDSVRANSAAKLATVLAGMLAGADSIEDLDVLRSGAAPRLFDDLRAPSTVGSWLRAFTRRARAPAGRSAERCGRGCGRWGPDPSSWPVR